MSYLCYTLDEAAQQLGMSETVLFRLSQFLKVPQSAYDDVGYIAFNGDLSFSDTDITFFRQVKDRLLAGETLEAIKVRLKQNQPIPGQQKPVEIHPIQPLEQPTAYEKATFPSGDDHLLPLRTTAKTVLQQQASLRQEQSSSKTINTPLNTIDNPTHFHREADKAFQRYRTQHRPKLRQVFQDLAKAVSDIGQKTLVPTPPIGLASMPAFNELFPKITPQSNLKPFDAVSPYQQPVDSLHVPILEPIAAFQEQQPSLFPLTTFSSKTLTPLGYVAPQPKIEMESEAVMDFPLFQQQQQAFFEDSEHLPSQDSEPLISNPLSKSPSFSSTPIKQVAGFSGFNNGLSSFSETISPAAKTIMMPEFRAVKPETMEAIPRLSALKVKPDITSDVFPPEAALSESTLPVAMATSTKPLTNEEEPWLKMIQATTSQPRALNIRLRAAAQIIQQKALQQMQASDTGS